VRECTRWKQGQLVSRQGAGAQRAERARVGNGAASGRRGNRQGAGGRRRTDSTRRKHAVDYRQEGRKWACEENGGEQGKRAGKQVGNGARQATNSDAYTAGRNDFTNVLPTEHTHYLVLPASIQRC
jgi:hypothetical protein